MLHNFINRRNSESDFSRILDGAKSAGRRLSFGKELLFNSILH